MLDRSTLERLYLDQERALYNIAMRWTWNAAEAQELVQETFVRVWARRHRVDPKTASSYIYRTTLNLCQKHARRRQRWQSLKNLFGVDQAHTASPDEALDETRLRAVIERLPDDQRQVLLLTEYTDLKQREIAELLDIPPGTVASRRNTAIKRLKEAFHEPEHNAAEVA